MNLPKNKGISAILIFLLMLSGTGLTSLYIEKNAASKEKGETAIRLHMIKAMVRIEATAWHELAEVRAVLADVDEDRTYAVDVLTMDKNGVIVATYPTEYVSSKGAKISDREHIVRAL